MTIPWLNQVEQVTERTGNDLVEVGMSKLKGLTLGDITTVRKGEGLRWHKFRQVLIENYSNVPYVSDAMVAYNNITQQDKESTSQYLIRAKVWLEHINHTSKLSHISGKGLNNLALFQVLSENRIRRVTKEQESWNTMEDIYRNINRIIKNEVETKAYQEPRYDSISDVLPEGIHEVSYNKGKRYSYDKSHNSSTFRKHHNNSPHHRYQTSTQS